MAIFKEVLNETTIFPISNDSINNKEEEDIKWIERREEEEIYLNKFEIFFLILSAKRKFFFSCLHINVSTQTDTLSDVYGLNQYNSPLVYFFNWFDRNKFHCFSFIAEKYFWRIYSMFALIRDTSQVKNRAIEKTYFETS